MDFLVRKRLGLCAISPVVGGSRSSWSGLLASLKTLVIPSVGELAVAISKVEVIGVRKSFPTRNLSAEATTSHCTGLGYTGQRSGLSPRLESLPFVRCGKVTADVPAISKCLLELHDPR